jgi:hypothetical protein
MDKKKVIDNIKKFFTSEVEEENMNFVDVKIEDGRIVRVSDMKEGVEIKEVTEDGLIDVEDGEYVSVDGLVITVKNGLIESITEKEMEDTEEVVEEEVEVVVEMSNVMRTDGVAIYYDGTELVEGTPLFLDEEMTEPAPDGPHDLEGGTSIVIEDGKLVSIEEVVEEEELGYKEKEMEEVFNSINSMKEELEKLKEENNELKSKFNKFLGEPSEEPIKEKISFNKINRDEKLKFFSKK